MECLLAAATKTSWLGQVRSVAQAFQTTWVCRFHACIQGPELHIAIFEYFNFNTCAGAGLSLGTQVQVSTCGRRRSGMAVGLLGLGHPKRRRKRLETPLHKSFMRVHALKLQLDELPNG